MPVKKSERNAFEAVCEIASRERWCWNMDCTTCGHMYFKYAFLELSDGKHPDIDGWVMRKSKHHALSRLLGPVPHPFRWPVERQRALVRILADASLLKIASLAKFPDWLGYVGLGLFYTEGREVSKRRLTKAWVPQLQELCVPDSGVDYVNEWVQDRRADTNAERAEFDTTEIEKALASALTALRAAREGLRDTVTTLELHSALGGATRSLTTLISRLPPHSGKLPLHGRAVFCPLAWAKGQGTLEDLSETSADFAAVVCGSQDIGGSGDLVLRELAVACESIRSMLGLLDPIPGGGS